jgi:putative cell wall-binding protein
MLRRVVTTLAVVAGVSAHATVAGATADATATRLAGADRFGTANVVATETFDQAAVAILTTGTNFPDALSATFLAGASASPVLLTYPDRLPEGLLATLEELSVEGVYVVGGEAAVSSDVINELQVAGYIVSRVAGENRYSTARQAAELLPREAIGDFMAGKCAVVVTGSSFADALAVGPLAAAHGMPILLTTKDSLHPDAENALLSLEIEQVLLVGGTGVISEAVAGRIDSLGIDVRRVAGANRQETSRLLAELATAELQFPTERVMLARGDSFADALTAGGRGGALAAPLLLTASPTSLGESAGAYLAGHADTIGVIEGLGGTSAVATNVLDEAVTVIRS